MTKQWYVVIDCGAHDVIMGDPLRIKTIAKITAKAIQKASPKAKIRTTRHPRILEYQVVSEDIPVQIVIPGENIIPV